jgi:hypothetical protein
MSEWGAKLWLKLLHFFASIVEIEPFLEDDPNCYCPCCGHRQGKIQAVVLDTPDASGSKVANLHECSVCRFRWLKESVTVVEHHALEITESEEKQEIEGMKRAHRNVRSEIVVNGGR